MIFIGQRTVHVLPTARQIYKQMGFVSFLLWQKLSWTAVYTHPALCYILRDTSHILLNRNSYSLQGSYTWYSRHMCLKLPLLLMGGWGEMSKRVQTWGVRTPICVSTNYYHWIVRFISKPLKCNKKWFVLQIRLSANSPRKFNFESWSFCFDKTMTGGI